MKLIVAFKGAMLEVGTCVDELDRGIPSQQIELSLPYTLEYFKEIAVNCEINSY